MDDQFQITNRCRYGVWHMKWAEMCFEIHWDVFDIFVFHRNESNINECLCRYIYIVKTDQIYKIVTNFSTSIGFWVKSHNIKDFPSLRDFAQKLALTNPIVWPVKFLLTKGENVSNYSSSYRRKITKFSANGGNFSNSSFHQYYIQFTNENEWKINAIFVTIIR